MNGSMWEESQLVRSPAHQATMWGVLFGNSGSIVPNRADFDDELACQRWRGGWFCNGERFVLGALTTNKPFYGDHIELVEFDGQVGQGGRSFHARSSGGWWLRFMIHMINSSESGSSGASHKVVAYTVMTASDTFDVQAGISPFSELQSLPPVELNGLGVGFGGGAGGSPITAFSPDTTPVVPWEIGTYVHQVIDYAAMISPFSGVKRFWQLRTRGVATGDGQAILNTETEFIFRRICSSGEQFPLPDTALPATVSP